jgi:hypothetical protein
MSQALYVHRVNVNRTDQSPGYSVLWYEVDEPQFGEYQIFNESIDDVFLEHTDGAGGFLIPPGGSLKFRLNRKVEIRAHRPSSAVGNGLVNLLLTDVSVSLPGGNLAGVE